MLCFVFVFFKQKTAYEMRISDWSSDVCSSDLKDPQWGYNAQTGNYTDLVKEGVIDPTKVVRAALQHAASVAGLLITTEAMIADRPEKKASQMPDRKSVV